LQAIGRTFWIHGITPRTLVMPVPESHRETDVALGPIRDEAAEASAPTSRTRENGGASRDHDDRQDDLKRALNESRRSAARLRKIIDTIPVLAWCSLPDGANEFMNQRWLDYTGVSSEGERLGMEERDSSRGSPQIDGEMGNSPRSWHARSMRSSIAGLRRCLPLVPVPD